MRFRLLFLCSSIVLNSSVAIFADEADPAVAAPNEADSTQPTPEKQVATLPKQSVAELIARARKSVVVITLSGRDGKNDGMGTGFVVSSDGLIATNLHVIGEARPIEVRFADDKRYPVIAIHATQRSMDLAVLRIDAKNLQPLQLADSDLLKQGQDVVAIGNPLGLEHSVVSGIVSGRREIDGKPMIQLAMPIEPGNSGGPLIDRQGRVHGILTLKSLVSPSVGFAVAVNSLKPLLKKPNPIPMSRWLTIGALDPSDWTPLFGARWRQRAGRLKVEGRGKGIGGRSLVLSKHAVPELPYELAVWVRMESDDGAAGLVFYADGGNKHYGFYPSNGKLRLSRFDGPDVFSWKVLREVRSRKYRNDEWNHLKVRLEENRIQCYVNDELVIESNDARYANGQVGLAKFRNTVAQFKSFRAEKNVPPTSPPAESVNRITTLVTDISPDRPPTSALIDRLLPDAASSATVLRDRARLMERQAKRLRELADTVQQKKTRAALIELLRKEEKDINLLRAALLIAKIDNEEVDVDAYLREVERMAAECSTMFPQDAIDTVKLETLNKYLFQELGFHGSRTDYYSRSNSYLNEVIDDREGLPITLSVLYMALGDQVGLNVVGVGTPGHFIVRYEPTSGEGQLIDPFDRGKLISRDEIANKVKSITGGELDDQHLVAQSKKSIILRMLQNLLGVAWEAEDFEGMLRYVETVVAVDPEAANQRWLRARLRFQTQRTEEALEDVEWILAREPQGVDMHRVREFREILEKSSR